MWFDVAAIAPGLHRITEGGMAHAYLVEGQDAAALVDSGIGIGDIGAEVRRLTSARVLVVNTHAHLDHVGGNRHFEAAFISERESLDEIEATAQRFREMATQDDFSEPLPEGFALKHYAPDVPPPAHLLAGGETIDLGGRTLEVLPTPGHTAGSICLLDEVNRFLFVGDTVTNRPLQGIGPGVTVATYKRSIGLLAEMAPDLDLILPAHGSSPLTPTFLAEFAAHVEQVDESQFQSIDIGGRKAMGTTMGPYTFFQRLVPAEEVEP